MKRALLMITTMLYILSSSCANIVVAQSQSELDSIYRGSPFYDEDSTECNQSSGGESDSIGTGSATKSMADFIDKYGQQAYENSIKSGVPYEFTLAQAILEGGLPLSDLAEKYNNFFGIKAGSSWTGKTVTLRTREEVNGSSVYVNAPFRVYDTAEEGFRDHDLFLRTNKRYAAAFAYSKDPMQFLIEIKNAGYATDSNYISLVGTKIKLVTAYIAKTNKWPASKDVTYALDPTFTKTSSDVSASVRSSPATSGCANKIAGVVANNAIQTAIALAWADKGHSLNDAKKEYIDAVQRYNPAAKGSLTDCGMFVSTVMRASGVDSSYPEIGTSKQLTYLRTSEKYTIIENMSDPSQLLPGDILIYNSGDEGHTMIYVGAEGGGLNTRHASLNNHVPQATSATLTSSGNQFTVARIKSI